MFPSAPLDVNSYAHPHARSRSLSLARSPTALTSSSLFFPHDRRPSHIAAAATTHEAHELGVVQPQPLLRRPSQLYKVVERPGSEDDRDAEALKERSRDGSRESVRHGALGLEEEMEMEMLMVDGEDDLEYEYDGPFEKPDRREMVWMLVSALVALSLAGMAFLTTIYNWVL